MGLNTGLVGKTYPSQAYEVTAEAIRAYAAATNEDNPAFTGSHPVAPPAFPIVPANSVLAGALFDPDLGANLPRLVHGEEDHILHEPIRAGDLLTVEACVESIEVKESGETFTVLTRLTNQNGTLAAELRSLMFIRGTAARRSKPAFGEGEASREILFETVQKVDPDQTHRYAEASGDHNPIHLDEDFATGVAGLPGIVCHGMCTMAFASKAVLDALAGGDPSRLSRIAVRFSGLVFPGETLTTRGWAQGRRSGVAVCGFETRNEKDRQVLRNGIAEIGDPADR